MFCKHLLWYLQPLRQSRVVLKFSWRINAVSSEKPQSDQKKMQQFWRNFLTESISLLEMLILQNLQRIKQIHHYKIELFGFQDIKCHMGLLAESFEISEMQSCI